MELYYTLDRIIELQNASGALNKAAVLKKYAGDTLFKDILYFVFNPYIKTNIGKAKLNKDFLTEDYYTSLIELFDDIASKNGDAVTCARVRYFIDRISPNYRDLVIDIICKTLKCGATATTLNKIYGKSFIPVGGCMLGTDIKKVHDKYKVGEFIVTEKYDGQRKCLIKDHYGKIFIFSGRNWIEDTNYPDIIAEASVLPNATVYDGEMIATGDFDSCIALRQATSSICNSKSSSKTGVKFIVFDAVPLEEFKTGKSSIPCKYRKNFVNNSVGIAGFKHIEVAKILGHVIDCDEATIAHYAEQIWAQGGEGIMLNNAAAPYEIKRSPNLLKVKRLEELDLRIVGFEYGTAGSKYANCCGALIVSYKGFTVGVGTGLSDGERLDIANNFERKYLNKICTVGTFGESVNAKGELSINAPKFICMRGDKDEADC